MHFTIEQEDSTTIFRLKEPRLDSMNASQLKAEFLILAQPDVEALIVDLSEVQYVDSAGLSALLLAERQQSEHGGEVRLVGVNDAVASLLRLTQLDRVFPMFATVDDALDAEPSFGDDDDEEVSNPGDTSPIASSIMNGTFSIGGPVAAADEMENMSMNSAPGNSAGSFGSPLGGMYAPSLSIDDDDYDDDEDYDDEEEDEFDEDIEEIDSDEVDEELDDEDFEEDEESDDEADEDADEDFDEDDEDYDEDEEEEDF